MGPIPVHRARHDAHAFAASGLTALLTGMSTAADWAMSVSRASSSFRSSDAPVATSTPSQAEFNTVLSKIRAAVE